MILRAGLTIPSYQRKAGAFLLLSLPSLSLPSPPLINPVKSMGGGVNFLDDVKIIGYLVT